jgi:hypothetical protein
MSNPYKRLRNLMAEPALDVGLVLSVESDGATVQLLTGGIVRVRGTATEGTHIYILGDVVVGPAPELEGVEIEV